MYFGRQIPVMFLCSCVEVAIIIDVCRHHFMLEEFVIEPREQTVAAHQRVEYQCQHATASVEWLINDDQVTVDRFPGVSTDQQSKSSRLVYKLIFNSVSSNYNNSMIQCKARFRDGDIMYQNETVSVLLLIQGLLYIINSNTRKCTDKKINHFRTTICRRRH